MLTSLLIISLLLTIPIGPGAFLVMKATLSEGFKSGIKVACGSILSDFLWISAAVFFPIFRGVIEANMKFISLWGGGLVCIIGIMVLLIRDKQLTQSATFGKALFASLCNVTIAISSTILLVRFVNGYENFEPVQKLQLSFGLVLGELFWWIVGLQLLTNFKDSISLKLLPKVYGCIIFLGGIIWIMRSLLH